MRPLCAQVGAGRFEHEISADAKFHDRITTSNQKQNNTYCYLCRFRLPWKRQSQLRLGLSAVQEKKAF